MNGKKIFQRTVLSATCTLALAGAAIPAHAINWLMLQGTEPAGASYRAKVWGFVQGTYEKDYSNPNPAGGYVPPKLLGPNLDSQSGFNILRARVGVRGTGFPLDSRINYFTLLELGNDGITNHGGSNYTPRLTDASVTLNYIPGARIRVGLFKTPGGEEALQGIPTLDYIDYTQATNLLLLERFANKGFTGCTGVAPPCNAATGNIGPYTMAQMQNGLYESALTRPVGAFRDTGIQFFDSFKVGQDWDLSYAAMIGNGSGVEFGNNNGGRYDKYLYFSAEKKFGGKGVHAQGVKFFAWGNWGTRLLDQTDDNVDNPQRFKRDRAGLGAAYRKKPFRFTAEYIKAKGMIFEGPDKPNFIFTSLNNSNGATAKGKGWYVEGGWYIPKTRWELDARYDSATRNDGMPDQFTFKTWTLGTQYHINPKTKVLVNYAIRDFSCDSGQAACTKPNVNLDGVDNRVGVELTAIF